MNRTIRIAVGSGVIALAAALVWMAQRSRTTRPERAGGSTPAAVDRSEPASVASESSADRADRREIAAPERADSPWWRSRLPEFFAPRAADPDGIAVEVLDDQTGSPIPDALVFVVFNGGEGPWGLSGSNLETLAANSPSFRTDAHGATAVRFSCVAVLLVAVKADRWGASACRWSDPPPSRIRLHANSDVTLCVVDDRGVPREGIPVRFGFKTPYQQLDFQWLEPLLRGTTDADGIVTFEGTARFPEPSPACEWGATPEITTAERYFWKIDRAALPREPMVCTLPPIGTIRVRIVDGRGSVLPLGGTGALYFPTAKSKSEPVQMITYRDGRSDLVVISVGLWVGTQSWLDGYGEFRGECEGPKSEGEERTLDLVVAEVTEVDITGTATWGDGSAAAGELEIQTRYPTGNPGQSQVTRRHVVAESDGTFHGKFARQLSNHGLARLSLNGTRGDGSRAFSDFIDVDLVHASDPMNLGRVALAHEESLLVAGAVVDAESLPLPNMGIMCHMEDAAFDRPWPSATMQRATTDVTGCYRLFAVEPQGKGRLTLIGRIDGWTVTAGAQFEAGESDLRLVAKAEGAIQGHVLLSPEIQSSDLSVALSYSQAGPPVQWNAVSKIAADGTFSFQDMEPGVVRVGVCRTGVNATAPLAGVEGVTIRSLEITRDPRLDPIDLRGRLHVVEVDVRVEAGAPAATGVLYAVDPRSGSGILEQFSLAGAPVRLHLVDPADVVIVAGGFRSELLRSVDGDRSVKLRPSAPQTAMLHFNGLGERRRDEEIIALIGSAEIPAPETAWRAVTIDAHGDASLSLDDPGSYRIVVKRGHRGMAREMNQFISITPQAFTLDEGDSEASFVFAAAN